MGQRGYCACFHGFYGVQRPVSNANGSKSIPQVEDSILCQGGNWPLWFRPKKGKV